MKFEFTERGLANAKEYLMETTPYDTINYEGYGAVVVANQLWEKLHPATETRQVTGVELGIEQPKTEEDAEI
jgi:hypothetical protein